MMSMGILFTKQSDLGFSMILQKIKLFHPKLLPVLRSKKHLQGSLLLSGAASCYVAPLVYVYLPSWTTNKHLAEWHLWHLRWPQKHTRWIFTGFWGSLTTSPAFFNLNTVVETCRKPGFITPMRSLPNTSECYVKRYRFVPFQGPTSNGSMRRRLAAGTFLGSLTAPKPCFSKYFITMSCLIRRILASMLPLADKRDAWRSKEDLLGVLVLVIG